ncbi:unnamed protein product [Fraxinus pennsylvanica]|uniref:Lactate/malate dehydrogenase C-terminal domain-containing protein n=1 Tax=Fraxinus pennsylvanica TaxID=56036 RepID=A0AAD1YPV5_9LAMI|nr:unnamed protein product [Fraxinus pennsylvanica]
MGGLQYLQFCFQGFSTRHLHVLSKPNSSITIPAFNASFPPSHYIYASKSFSHKLTIPPYSYSLNHKIINLSTTMSSLVYIFLYLYYLHACTGRPLAVFDQENSSQIQLSGKDVKTPGAEKFVMQGNFRAEYGEKTFYDAHAMKLNNQKAYIFKEGEDIKGNEVKISYFGKIFEGTAEKMERKREARSTLESLSKKANKNAISKESDNIEDIVKIVHERKTTNIHKEVVDGSYEVIRLKGDTSWSIGCSVASLARTILSYQRQIHPVSVLAKGLYDIEGGDMFPSLPEQLCRSGILGMTDVHLMGEEVQRLKTSVKLILELLSELAI